MKATISKIELPKFASEEEEANWYPAHPEFLEALFEQARAEGRLVRGPIIDRSELTTPITLRISQGDLEKARTQAKKKGIGYQTYMKMLLREALNQSQPQASGSETKVTRTPQDKKKLSLERDRRNIYGNNQKAARKSIPKSKQLGNRSARHAAEALLVTATGLFDEAVADHVEAETKSAQLKRKGNRFAKWPDRPLGEVLNRKAI